MFTSKGLGPYGGEGFLAEGSGRHAFLQRGVADMRSKMKLDRIKWTISNMSVISQTKETVSDKSNTWPNGLPHKYSKGTCQCTKSKATR